MIAFYYRDFQSVKQRIESIQSSIKDMDKALQAGSKVFDEMNQIRTEFINSKENLLSVKVSGPYLMSQLSKLKALAKEMEVNVENVEVDPRNTFPIINQNDENDEIKIERQSVNFKLSGNFINIGRFIDEVEKNHSMFQMQYCSIGLDSLDPEGVIADLEYLTYGEFDS